MGTRSLTIPFESYNKIDTPIMVMYRQYDGYPEGHGIELAEFLSSFDAIVNGIGLKDKRRIANGMGCLAAQIVAHFKEGVGQFYLCPTDSTDCGQEYEYEIYNDSGNIIMKVKDTYDGEYIFNGTPKEFLAKYKENEQEVS